MPDFCSAFGCSNERNAKTKEQGITFHRFPKDKAKRQSWTLAMKRKDFEPNDRSVVCSLHFKSEDFDKTGQTTRLREGVTPSFPYRLRKVPRSSRSHKAAAESPDVYVQLIEGLQMSPAWRRGGIIYPGSLADTAVKDSCFRGKKFRDKRDHSGDYSHIAASTTTETRCS
ncbi:THAP domain-containing protein 6-like isoform X2 [Sebastes fasciatus]|uniref:THAP domain-containing protein 6-like isoform X2 n=1 Tax=Sebastes fasciatus TaxID=394691 RepID=UPI003D9E51D8